MNFNGLDKILDYSIFDFVDSSKEFKIKLPYVKKSSKNIRPDLSNYEEDNLLYSIFKMQPEIYQIKSHNKYKIIDLLQIAKEKKLFLMSWNKDWKKCYNLSVRIAFDMPYQIYDDSHLLLAGIKTPYEMYYDDEDRVIKLIEKIAYEYKKCEIIERQQINSCSHATNIVEIPNINYSIAAYMPVDILTIENLILPTFNLITLVFENDNDNIVIKRLYPHPQFSYMSSLLGSSDICFGNYTPTVESIVNVLRNMNYNSHYSDRYYLPNYVVDIINEIAIDKTKKLA